MDSLTDPAPSPRGLLEAAPGVYANGLYTLFDDATPLSLAGFPSALVANRTPIGATAFGDLFLRAGDRVDLLDVQHATCIKAADDAAQFLTRFLVHPKIRARILREELAAQLGVLAYGECWGAQQLRNASTVYARAPLQAFLARAAAELFTSAKA